MIKQLQFEGNRNEKLISSFSNNSWKQENRKQTKYLLKLHDKEQDALLLTYEQYKKNKLLISKMERKLEDVSTKFLV